MANRKYQAAQLLGQVKSEWEENKRLQMIAWAALILFVLFIHSQINNWRLAKLAEYNQQLTKLEDLKALVDQKSWVQHAETSTQLWSQQQKKIWVATTEGEAQARLRDWLQGQAQELGLNIGRIRLEMGPAPKGLVWRPLRVDMQGTYTPGILQRFLQRLNNAPGTILVDYEQITLESNPFYRLNLTAWVELRAEVHAEARGDIHADVPEDLREAFQAEARKKVQNK